MEEPSSIENQMAMAPVIGNMAHLCLLCAEARSPEEEPFIDIYGELGKQLNISEKIHKFLTIAIEAGFPLQVCVACVGKLNVCQELVQSSEKAHEKFKSLRDEWQASQSCDVKGEPLDDMEDTSSPMDVDVPSPETEFPIEPQELKTEPQPMKKSQKKSPEATVDENQLQEYSILQQPSPLVQDSQIVFVVAEEDVAVKYQFKLSLVLINMNEDCANNQEIVTEKITRAMQFVKKRFATKQGKFVDKEKSVSFEPLHSCQSCKCSFFLQEEMVSHFESLHPEEVLQCSVCDEKICGPVQVQEKHMDLHLALEKGQTEQLLRTLQVPTVNIINIFDPEFVLVPLGNYPPRLNLKAAQSLQSEFLIVVQRCKWIKPDMKDQISRSIKMFVSKIKLYKRVRRQVRPKLECDLCGKKMNKKSLEGHMERMHNPEKMQCCHCNDTYMAQDEVSHIELHHNGGKNLICKICDSKFNASGEDQPHMIPKSDFPFKCSAKSCRKVYQTEANLEKHKQTRHSLKPDKPPCLCELCGKIYSNKDGLKQHLKLVHFPESDTVYTCEICGVTLLHKESLLRHKSNVHDPKVPCHICSKLFNKRHLKRHIRLHTEEPKIPCQYCGRLFLTSINCKLHEQRRHEGVILRCSICKDMSFKSVRALEEHHAKHERGEEIILPKYLQPAQCSVCSQVFINSVKLGQHMKSHEREKRNEYVVSNKRVIKGRESTFPCYPCLIRFMTQESYDNHVETCHPDGAPNIFSKPKGTRFRYQCRYCEKTFRKKDFCNDHETLHGSGKQYACDFCGKRYSYYSDKWTHQNKKCAARLEVEAISASS